jgi:hypothetical protein
MHRCSWHNGVPEANPVSAKRWNRAGLCRVQPGVDEIEREAIRAEGLDPDDPVVVTAIDFARWELSLLGR